MKNVKTLLAAAVAATTFAAPVLAEVSGSVGVASTYLWRGYDLGSGTPAVSGDLSYSAGGAYGGIWGSSGDTTAGTEFDLYVGYGMEFDSGFMFDISAWNYVYPTGAGYTDGDTDIFEMTDVILTVGFGPVSFSYYEPVGYGSGGDYNYYTLGGSFGAFGVTVGMHEGEDDEAIHINLDYAFNDNLTFTFSQFTDKEDAAIFGDDKGDLKFVVSYSIPLM